jgi:hypothetical protein
MRLGVVLSSSRPDGSPLTGEGLIAEARQIEELGFDSFWCFDAILLVKSPSEANLAAIRALWSR